MILWDSCPDVSPEGSAGEVRGQFSLEGPGAGSPRTSLRCYGDPPGATARGSATLHWHFPAETILAVPSKFLSGAVRTLGAPRPIPDKPLPAALSIGYSETFDQLFLAPCRSGRSEGHALRPAASLARYSFSPRRDGNAWAQADRDIGSRRRTKLIVDSTNDFRAARSCHSKANA